MPEPKNQELRKWNEAIRLQLASLRLAPARESEITEELMQHAEERFHELCASGLAEAEAHRLVFEELRGPDLFADELRAVEQTNVPEPVSLGSRGAGRHFAGSGHDVRYAFRALRKERRFSFFAIGMLAFGIGATTVIFSIMEGVLLRPLPFAHPEQLVVLGDHVDGTNWGEEGNAAPVTAPEIPVYMRETHSFQSLGGLVSTSFEMANPTSGGGPVVINATRMTAGTFPMLGVAPLLGRTFTQDEDEKRQLVTVLSYATWQGRFHGSPQVLGTKILLDRKPYLVVGVMPRNFEFPLNPGQLNRNELWVPMSFSNEELGHQNGNWSMELIGRLKPGITPAQAQTDAERVAQGIMRSFPATLASIHIRAVTSPLREATVLSARPLVHILFLAVMVVLLIACANLTGMLLVRVIRRKREIAVRLALGASSITLLRQLLLESLMLSVSGGVLGVGLAELALRVGKNLLPETMPRISEIGLDWQVVWFALALAVMTGLVCGLAPALAALRTNINTALKNGGTGSTGGGHARLRSALVVAETAVALTLLIASGLLIRSFKNMSAVDLGYRPQQVTIAGYALPQKQYVTQPGVDAFNEGLLARLRALPGVEFASLSSNAPGQGASLQTFIAEGYVAPKGAGLNVAVPFQVKSDYFQTMKVPLLRGRYFNDEDHAGTQLVVIVNQKFAQHFWPDQDPVGKRMRIGTVEQKSLWMTVVGEIADVKLDSPDANAIEQFYQQMDQVRAADGELVSPGDLNGTGGFIVVRSALPAKQMEDGLRSVVKNMDPLLPLTQVQTMEQVVAGSETERRFNTVLITSFAIAAVLLAVLGIYSIIAFSVVTREKEMAIRMALGSQRMKIVNLIVRSGIKLAGLGCVLGVAGAAAVSSLLRSMVFNVSPFDPVVIVAAVFVVVLLALGASAVPALRASSIDPMQALRGE